MNKPGSVNFQVMPNRNIMRRPYRPKATALSQPQKKEVAKIAKRQVNKVSETKWYYRATTGFIELANMTPITPTTGFARGTTANNYTGNDIKMMSFKCRLQLIAADAPGNMVRILVIQDKSVSGTPQNSTVFWNTSYPWLSPLNPDFTDTYNVLYDRQVLLSNDGATSSGFLPKLVNINIPARRLRKMTFTTASGAIDSGGIWVCLVSDSNAVTHPTFVAFTEIKYKDA